MNTKVNEKQWMSEWTYLEIKKYAIIFFEWMDGWINGLKAVLSIAYSNQKAQEPKMCLICFKF